MKQLLQNLGTGKTELTDVPVPVPGANDVLIQSVNSVVSLGTERMLVSFGKASMIDKIRQQPERVLQVLDKIKSDGLGPALNAVRSRLDEPIPLGYSNAGIVLEVGENVTDIAPGDRVVSNGPHAEIVNVPRNLVARIPKDISFEDASFTVIASIALQGLRLVNPTLGETVVVIGLGLIGQIAVQLALADGCRVIGCDIDQKKVDLANSSGAIAFKVAGESDPVQTVMEYTKGSGADAVLITASSEGNTIISQSAGMSRKRGRIVLVGVVGLELNRKDFYDKELSFQVSCSYGPGRYDLEYEQKGIDYPLPYVRWTEQRNFEAVIDAITRGRLKVQPLISNIINFENSMSVYESITSSNTIATVFKYRDVPVIKKTVLVTDISKYNTSVSDKPSVAVIGSGIYAKATLLPLLSKTGVSIKYICSHNGASSTYLAKKFKIPYSTTDYHSLLSDKEIDAVMIATRHNLHASMIIDALKAGKKVFVEKPLSINKAEMEAVISAREESNGMIMVGFNRRFSPFACKAKQLTGNGVVPVNVIMTINAGALPQEHWTNDITIGGGRIVGEACHFIDLFRFLCGNNIVAVCASGLGMTFDKSSDNVMLLLKAENGSQCAIHYLSNGNKKFPKEDIKIFVQGKVVHIDNFRYMTGYGFKNFRPLKGKQDKGHQSEFNAFVASIRNGVTPIPFNEIINVTEASLAALESLQTGSWIKLNYC